jgi:hypothetical protein
MTICRSKSGGHAALLSYRLATAPRNSLGAESKKIYFFWFAAKMIDRQPLVTLLVQKPIDKVPYPFDKTKFSHLLHSEWGEVQTPRPQDDR